MRRCCGRETWWLPRPGQLPSAVPWLVASLQAGAAAGRGPPRSSEADLGATMSGNRLKKSAVSLFPEKTVFSSLFLPSLVK